MARGAAPAGQTAVRVARRCRPSARWPALDADAVRMIIYTSGTTGRPKGVLHSHNSIHALIRQIGEHWLVEPGDTFLVPSPIAHIGGSIYAFECPILLGTTAVLMDRWDADEAVDLMRTERCTHMAGATPFLAQLLAAARRAGTRLPDLKVFICGGASVSPSLIRSAATISSRPSSPGYTARPRFRSPPSAHRTTPTMPPTPTAGPASPTSAWPPTPQRRTAPVRSVPVGPRCCSATLHPEDDADGFDADGYFRTGDLGRWVDDGYLVVTGRAKDIIIRNGENIAPKEVEDMLAGHPGIAEIAIVGLPDARTGERACAVIVSAAPPGPTVADLREFLTANGVATFKAPNRWSIWDALPKNDAGKVLKHQIRAAVDAQGE